MISSVLGIFIAKRGVLSPGKTFNRTTVERKCAHGLKVNVYPSFWEVGNLESPAQLEEGMCNNYVLAWCSMFHSFSFVMQHDYFQETYFDPTPGVEGVCNDTLCLHGALCYIPFTTMLLLPSSPLI